MTHDAQQFVPEPDDRLAEEREWERREAHQEWLDEQETDDEPE